MEIWLKQNKEAIQLPILPPSFSIGVENGHQTVNVQTKGEVVILGKKGLKTLELSSFFPNADYPFAAYAKDRDPYEYVKKLEAWQEEPIRVTITETNINLRFIMQSFSYGEPDGTGDVEYTISLKEYRKPNKGDGTGSGGGASSTTQQSEEDARKLLKRPTKSVPKTYVVKKGDNLWNLAKNFYGSGKKHTKLYNANKYAIEKEAKKRGLMSSANKGINGWWIFPGTKLVVPK